MPDNNRYNSKLKGFARDLRNKSTKTEILLWRAVLRAKKMRGYPFRRQRPIGNFIADFCCLSLKIVIEVDGYTHDIPEVIRRDERKDRFLESEGFVVLRIMDADVLEDLNGVAERIEGFVDRRVFELGM